MRLHRVFTLPLVFFAVVSLVSPVRCADAGSADDAGRRWTAAPPWNDPAFFPLAVWLQNPRHAERYRAAGINTYVGLWRGPTEEQLTALRRAGMNVICAQNEVALRHRDDPMILAWMHGDEPDNAQRRRDGREGYDPPIPPSAIVEHYRALKAADPSRPVLLNLGQGVAWDDYIGRGVRRRHPEDYPEYMKGADIVSFDIYPVAHPNDAIRGNLWYVARGVERLVGWGAGGKMIWNCLECTHISQPERKATPLELHAEAWMALIHGSRGLIYFVHEFKPRQNEAALLDDPAMLAAVTALNREITQLAPVLNSATIPNRVKVETHSADAPVAAMLKHHGGATYVFSVAMRGTATEAAFTIADIGSTATAEVLGENRTVRVTGGTLVDRFEPWAVHLYRIREQP